MKPTPRPRTGNGITLSWVKWYLLFGGLFFSTVTLSAQKAKGSILPSFTSTIQDNDLKLVNGDTSSFHKLYLRFQAEREKRGTLNLDSLIHFGHAALREANTIQYDEGLIKVYLGLGSGYVDKGLIDSALFYTKRAVSTSKFVSDAHLKAQAYMGYAWTLVYDDSNYKEAIGNAIVAQMAAAGPEDTLLWIDITTKLIKIYYEANYMAHAFRTCSELIRVCEIRKDTVA